MLSKLKWQGHAGSQFLEGVGPIHVTTTILAGLLLLASADIDASSPDHRRRLAATHPAVPVVTAGTPDGCEAGTSGIGPATASEYFSEISPAFSFLRPDAAGACSHELTAWQLFEEGATLEMPTDHDGGANHYGSVAGETSPPSAIDAMVMNEIERPLQSTPAGVIARSTWEGCRDAEGLVATCMRSNRKEVGRASRLLALIKGCSDPLQHAIILSILYTVLFTYLVLTSKARHGDWRHWRRNRRALARTLAKKRVTRERLGAVASGRNACLSTAPPDDESLVRAGMSGPLRPLKTPILTANVSVTESEAKMVARIDKVNRSRWTASVQDDATNLLEKAVNVLNHRPRAANVSGHVSFESTPLDVLALALGKTLSRIRDKRDGDRGRTIDCRERRGGESARHDFKNPAACDTSDNDQTESAVTMVCELLKLVVLVSALPWTGSAVPCAAKIPRAESIVHDADIDAEERRAAIDTVDTDVCLPLVPPIPPADVYGGEKHTCEAEKGFAGFRMPQHAVLNTWYVAVVESASPGDSASVARYMHKSRQASMRDPSINCTEEPPSRSSVEAWSTSHASFTSTFINKVQDRQLTPVSAAAEKNLGVLSVFSSGSAGEEKLAEANSCEPPIGMSASMGYARGSRSGEGYDTTCSSGDERHAPTTINTEEDVIVRSVFSNGGRDEKKREECDLRDPAAGVASSTGGAHDRTRVQGCDTIRTWSDQRRAPVSAAAEKAIDMRSVFSNDSVCQGNVWDYDSHKHAAEIPALTRDTHDSTSGEGHKAIYGSGDQWLAPVSSAAATRTTGARAVSFSIGKAGEEERGESDSCELTAGVPTSTGDARGNASGEGHNTTCPPGVVDCGSGRMGALATRKDGQNGEQICIDGGQVKDQATPASPEPQPALLTGNKRRNRWRGRGTRGGQRRKGKGGKKEQTGEEQKVPSRDETTDVAASVK